MAWCEDRALLHAPQISLAALESYQRYLRHYLRANGQPLTPGDVDFTRGALYVRRGKGYKDRVVPLGDSAGNG
ncbi:hypothetical protein V4Y72_000996 [Citrobacter freundii]